MNWRRIICVITRRHKYIVHVDSVKNVQMFYGPYGELGFEAETDQAHRECERCGKRAECEPERTIP